MRLVDDDQICTGKLGGHLMDGLDTGHGDLMLGFQAKTGRPDADGRFRPIANDGLRVLGDQFLDVREHNNASGRIGVDGSMDERGQSQRLAGTRGQNDQRVSVSRAEVVIQGVDAGLLVWAQYRLHATCANDP